MVDIYTAHYSYIGSDRLDVTVQGNHPIGHIFAPTWYMVDKIRNGEMTEEQYRRDYYTIIRNRYFQHRDIWDKVSQWKSVTFVCFCNPKDFCHRYLLARYFPYLYKDSKYLGERFFSFTNTNQSVII